MAALFVNEGWNGVTHLQVANATGIARSTIYRHWPTRYDLLSDALAARDSESHASHHTGDLCTDLAAALRAFDYGLFDTDVGERMAALA